MQGAGKIRTGNLMWAPELGKGLSESLLLWTDLPLHRLDA